MDGPEFHRDRVAAVLIVMTRRRQCRPEREGGEHRQDHPRCRPRSASTPIVVDNSPWLWAVVPRIRGPFLCPARRDDRRPSGTRDYTIRGRDAPLVCQAYG